MKPRFLSFFIGLTVICATSFAQVPKGFNYQAIARDASQNILANANMKVRLDIQTSVGTLIYQETFNPVTSNAFGLITLVVGSGTQTGGSAASFAAIDWNQMLYLKTVIMYPISSNIWTVMGTSQIWSVPYALVADKANGVNSGTKLSVISSNDAGTDALFEVKRADGQTVFAVYPNAVNVYVPKSTFKGVKGGFAVGGYDGSKAGSPGTIQDYLRVTPDSVRIYVDPNPTATGKGVKGGFAVGGYDESKGINSMYFNLTPNSSVQTVASSPQVLWYPTKNAFLAGNIHIGHVDSVGMYSTSLGYQSIAMGKYSQAFGYKTKALGDYSTAIGKNSVAGARSGDRLTSTASNSFALGNGTKATGDDSYAFGSGAQATGIKSFAFGSVGLDDSGNPTAQQTTASGDYSTALGMGAQATARGAMALGVGSISSGTYSSNLGYYSSAGNTYSTAIGYKSNAAGYASFTFGRNSYSVGSYSVAIGDSAKTQASYAAALGNYAKAKGTASFAIGYNAQTTATGGYSGALGYYAKAGANYSVAIGFSAQTTSTATGSGALGFGSIANGPYSVVVGPSATTGASANYAGSFGYSADALAPNSVAIGYNAQTATTATSAGSFGYSASASGPYSVAVGPSASTGASANYAGSFGYMASATGVNSVAVGYGASSTAQDASAFGKSATASNTAAMALGSSSAASGANSVAMGYTAQASGSYSMALGYGTIASNTDATSLGYSTTASGTYSTALGYSSQALGDKSLAIGSLYTYSYVRCMINRLTGLFTCHTYTGSVGNQAKRAYSAAIGNGNYAEDGGMAIGSRNNATSSGSTAIGYLNTADTTFAFAGGYESASHGISAIALGDNVTAEAASSLVVGSFNATSTGYDRYNWVETDPLFVIGNGDETNGGHDAVRVNKNGGAYINAENAYAGLWVTNSNTSSNPNTSFGLGIMSGIQRNKAGLNYYSGYFYQISGSLGTYNGLYADVRTGGSVDVAEYIYDTNANTQPADVVVADRSNKESIVKSSEPYQTSVVGVISTKPHMTMGMELVTDEKTGKPLENAKPAARLALSGRVPVNVCGENGNIFPGDYLTSSSKPGVAMKWSLLDVSTAKDFDELKKILAENERRRGAIIGKAVESFSGTGTGQIKVLISLQ